MDAENYEGTLKADIDFISKLVLPLTASKLKETYYNYLKRFFGLNMIDKHYTKRTVTVGLTYI